MSSANTARYEDLPRSYHIFKWRILLAFAGFYLFLYLGRFNFWPVAPLVKEDLALSNFEIGLVNALLLWGFGLGDLVHGRLAETYGLRLWVLVGAILTTVFNIITSFATSAVTMAIPWGIAGFVNAACWAPGISMVSQWWPRRHRGLAMGIVGTASGGAMVMMWWISGYVGAEWGWRAAFRYPPLIIVVLGIAFYFLARDRPSDVDLPEYVEEDEVSAAPESLDPERFKGFGPYKELLSNPRFLLASHVKGLENVVRYGLTTWVPIYYFEEGGLSIESTILLTILLPIGYLIAPPVAGIISDRYPGQPPPSHGYLFLHRQRLGAGGHRPGPAGKRYFGRYIAADRWTVHGHVLNNHDGCGHRGAAYVRDRFGPTGRPWVCLRWGPGPDLRRRAGHGRQPLADSLLGYGGHQGGLGDYDLPRQRLKSPAGSIGNMT